MAIRDEIAAQTSIRRKLLASGYVPLANRDKMCVLPGWSRMTVDEAQIGAWSEQFRWRATGVRLEGRMVVLDFDVDNDDALDEIYQTMPDDLFEVISGMPERRGKGAKFALFGRLPEGEPAFVRAASAGYSLPGVDPQAEDAVIHRLEVFGSKAGRQFGVAGAHTIGNDGEVAVEYTWREGVGLWDVPLDQLPVISTEQVVDICRHVGETLERLGWGWHRLFKRSGMQSAEAIKYDLTEAVTFETNDGHSVDLATLEDLAGGGGVRVSMSWLEGPAARNKTRGLVSIHPADGRVSVLDTATWVRHRPADLDRLAKTRALGERLAGLGASTYFGAPASADDGEADGPGDFIRRQRAPVLIRQSEEDLAVDAAADAIAESGMFYDFGGRLSTVFEGHVHTPDDYGLSYALAKVLDCMRPGKPTKDNDKPDPVPVDPPLAFVKKMRGSDLRRLGLPELVGISDVPVMRLDGSISAGEGYDAETKVLVLGGGDVVVPDVPTRDQMAQALETLWSPFREFPFVSAAARGGMLAALLTAAIRRALPSAPAFAFDAPTQGSGKTLLARCVSVLSGEEHLHAPLPTHDEDEIRKILTALLVGAPASVIFDNQLGTLNSASLAAMLTSDRFDSRLLGSSTRVKLPTRCVVMLTGNNVSLAGDMPRRVVTVRVDAEQETPFLRQFDFNPLAEVRKNRRAMVAAALTLIRGSIPLVAEPRLGSFEDWDRLVAQPVAAVSAGVGRGQFGDPMELLAEAQQRDENYDVMRTLLTELRRVYGSRWFMPREVVQYVEQRGAGAGSLRQALEDVTSVLTPRSVGIALKYRNGSIVAGHRLQVLPDAKWGNKYRVWTESDRDGVVVNGVFGEET